MSATSPLPRIPHHQLHGADWPLALFHAERARADLLSATARRMLPAGALALADRQSRLWLVRRGSPYMEEIAAIASEMGKTGAWALNLSYEWGCSTRATASPDGTANRLIRVLDWPLHGAGREVVAATVDHGPAPWTALTWPGYTGVVQAIAPGRFAAAFNQAPLRRQSSFFALDWLRARLRLAREFGMPPAHLLRQVFEAAVDYEDARRRLSETPIALPAIFILSGIRPNEGCIIERLETEARIHDGSGGVANHWLCPEWAARGDWPRGIDSRGRGRAIRELLPDFPCMDWPKPPVLNKYTRLAMIAEASSGRLMAQGHEEDGPATDIFYHETG